MYNYIVARESRKNFEYVNKKEYEALLKGCSENIHHKFGGEHAVGGERTGKAVLRKWLQRLGRLCPNLRLTVTDVWVKGMPWDTTVIVRWKATDDNDPDGTPYRNHGVHIIKMKWFKAVDIDANEDSHRVFESMQRKAAAGWEEAKEPPVTS